MAVRRVSIGRVSTDEQDNEGHSLETQAERNLQNAIRLYGPDIKMEYANDVCSGAIPLADRKEAGKFYKTLKKGDQWFCTKADRFGRSLSNAMKILDHLNAVGVILHVLNVDGGNPCTGPDASYQTKAMLHMMLSFAEMEREMIKERSREGREQMRANNRKGLKGPTTGRPPCWTKGRFAIPEKRALIERMLDMMKTKGDKQIATIFQKEGIPTMRGAGEWSPQTIKSIFHNVALRGYLMQGHWEEFPGRRDPSKMVKVHIVDDLIKDHYDVIITDQAWDVLNQIRKKREKGDASNAGGRTGKLKNLLKGIAVCEHCGKPCWYYETVRKVGKHRAKVMTPLAPPEGFNSSIDAADAHECHYATIRNWIREGKPGFRWLENPEQDDAVNIYNSLVCRTAFQNGPCEFRQHFPYPVAERLVMTVMQLIGLHNEWWNHPDPAKQAEVVKLTGDIPKMSVLRKDKYSRAQDADDFAEVDKLDAEIAAMEDALNGIRMPDYLAEVYAPNRVEHLLALYQRNQNETGSKRAATRREILDILKVAIDKVILHRHLEITIRLQITNGVCLEFRFNHEGEYVSHGTRDLNGNLTHDDPRPCMAELNHLLNRWLSVEASGAQQRLIVDEPQVSERGFGEYETRP